MLLKFLLGHVRARVQDTFGDIVSKEYWQLIDHTANTDIHTIVAENIYRFAKKQCSDLLDVFYSVLSISTDGSGF